MLRLGKILHPTDFSETSDYAFRLACALAQAAGAIVHVLHVGADPGERIGAPTSGDYYDALTRKLYRMRAENPEIVVEEQLVFVDDPAAEILRVAHAIHPDLIVMGTHGRSGLGRLLAGSTAEHVLRKAACPVVTVKLPASYVPPHREGDPVTGARPDPEC